MIVVYFFWTTSLTLNAQINKPLSENSPGNSKIRKIEFIVGPSLLYSRGTGNNKDDPRRVTYGYSFGIGFPQFQSKRFELTTRLLYERKGYATKYSNVDSAGNLSEVYNKQKLYYYSLTILPSYFLGERKRTKIIAGAYLSLLGRNSFEQKAFVNSQFSFSYVANNVKGRFNNYDYGILGGFSHNMVINNTIDIGVQLLGNLGLANIVPSKFVEVVIKPCSLSLSLILTYKH